MNLLFLIPVLACPIWIAEFALRGMHMTPPVWVGDSMAFALMLSGLGLVFRAVPSFRRPERPELTPDPVATLPVRDGGEGSALDELEQSLPCLFHEIRNYSCSLRGNAVLLRRQLQSDSALEPLRRLERTSEKLETIASEILGASAKGSLSRSGPVDLQHLIRDCIQDNFPDAKHAFRVLPEGVIPSISGDGLKLERAFLNLFRNAFEAGARVITVRLCVAPDRIQVAVEDDGEGCAPEHVAQLFRPLYSTKKDKGGTGLGLYLVKGTLELHGGTIKAFSKNGSGEERGMTFRLEFPRKGGELRSRSVIAEASNPVRHFQEH
jgi:signal transduction histidine kinase